MLMRMRRGHNGLRWALLLLAGRNRRCRLWGFGGSEDENGGGWGEGGLWEGWRLLHDLQCKEVGMT